MYWRYLKYNKDTKHTQRHTNKHVVLQYFVSLCEYPLCSFVVKNVTFLLKQPQQIKYPNPQISPHGVPH